jgi:hypothetical protein
MNIKEKFNEYIASGDPFIIIATEERDFILPFIEKCVEEERRGKTDNTVSLVAEAVRGERQRIAGVVGYNSVVLDGGIYVRSSVLLQSLTQEDKIK